MFAGASREQLRSFYLDTWRKFRAGAPLEPLEAQVAAVIAEHPEYVPLLEHESTLRSEFDPESGQLNPFLHLSLHLALREQLATDRPRGISQVHHRLSARDGAHEAEHLMLEVLGETLWAAQRGNQPPDETKYLERLKSL